MPTQLTDLELIQAYKTGDERAGEEIYLRYFNRTVLLCQHYLHFSDEANDAAQEVFYKILVQKKIFNFRAESHFWAWIKRIAFNVCHEFFRKRKQLRELSSLNCEEFQVLQDSLPAKSSNPEEAVLKAETQAVVQQTIQRLPQIYQDAVWQRFIEERSYRETARESHTSAGVIGVHLLRGKRMLVDMFEEKFPEYVPRLADLAAC